MKQVRSNWRMAILVCRKCTKKVGGGFGPKGNTALVRALRSEAGLAKGRKATTGVIEVGCLKICPKHAVTVVDTARPGEWLVVKAGTDVAEVAERLGLIPDSLSRAKSRDRPSTAEATDVGFSAPLEGVSRLRST